ncbi:MAG: hypothetical protein ACR2P2_08140 [Nakamurella sp.]
MGELEDAKAALAEAMAELPAEDRRLVPADAQGVPVVEFVRALFRYEHPRPGEVNWIQIRELSETEWSEVIAAHNVVYRLTRGLDGFPAFAWGDLQNAHAELLRQLKADTYPNEWMAPLIEYRILNLSTALKMYHEHVCAQVNRTGDDGLKQRISETFSELYDRSFGYRLLYSMRNAFQHGVRGLVRLEMTARLADGSDTERESEALFNLDKTAFAASRANGTVRREVAAMPDDTAIDLFELGSEAFDEIEALHARLSPLLYPGAPDAARLLTRYMVEIGGKQAYFHEYVRGLPTKGILGTTTLDRGGFEYVSQVVGNRANYDGNRPPGGPSAVLPRYV